MAKNLLSVDVPAQTITQIQEKLKELRELLAPYVVTLTVEDRKSLPKMSDKTLAFVSKTAEYVKTNPKLIPPMMEAEELGKDFAVNQALQPVYNSLKQLVDNLSDTLMLSGHEAYAQALLYYASVKMAAKLGDVDAKSIQEDLGKRFVKQSRLAKTPENKPNEPNPEP
ncbi:MAG: hypothetical protein Q3983_01060 [Capnocytophaga sp.]|nr:hypothetical protein [Capnocytophaga sp.]